MRRAPLLAVASLLLVGCDHYGIFGPDGRRFEGFYSYVGTVDDRYGHTVAGEIIISHARGGRADVDIDWTYFEFGDPIFRIRSDYPALADLDPDGDIDFDFEGELFLYGRPVWFRLSHDGRLSGHTIYGDWRLRTDLPTTDRGAFTARR